MSCISPSGFSPPTGTSGVSSIVIEWTEPEDSGGCPVTGYAVYRNDGDLTEPITEITPTNYPAIRTNPSLRTATITSFPISPEGLTFLIKVEVITSETSTKSSSLSIKLAGVPGTPTTAPTLIQSDTDTSRITVELAKVTNSGNDPIVTYNLQIDNGKGGEFTNIAGYSTRSLQRTHTISEGISRGKNYRIRYRVGNTVGWSDFSDNLVAKAATIPDIPEKPTLSSSSSTLIQLNLFESGNNQGSSIQLYELWMNTGVDGSSFSLIYSTTTLPSTYDVTNIGHSIVSGTFYTFRIRAKNGIDYSSFSSESRYASASLPGAPNAPTKVEAESNSTHITIEWTEATPTEISIVNYRLYVSHNADDFTLIHDAGFNVLNKKFTYKGELIIGDLYSFKVSAMNLNGEGALSPALNVHACNAPSQPDAPTRVTSTTTTISLTWAPPLSDGGCSLTGYSLLTDSGTGGLVTTEVDTALNTSPETLLKIVTLSSGLTGSWIRFRITAYNAEGQSTSRTIQYVLAQTPNQPLLAPSEVTDETTDTQIVVQATEIVSPENGGSSITGYEFQIDDGNLGEYVTAQGGSDDRTLALKASITLNIIKGRTYRVRYRGINSVGEGEWSIAVEVIASTTPGKPDIPIITSALDTAIGLAFTPVTNNGGQDLIGYELYFSNSTISLSTFTQDTNYDGSSMAYSFSIGIVAGNTYGFKIRAVNGRGPSDFSYIIYAASGKMPNTPVAPTHDLSGSNRTHVKINWAEGTSLHIPVLGYRLSADDRRNGEFEVIYTGYGNPNVLSFVHGPLKTGEIYQYYVEVLNFNGPSVPSPKASVYVCEAPSEFNSLEKISSTSTQIEIAWQPPQDNGG